MKGASKVIVLVFVLLFILTSCFGVDGQIDQQTESPGTDTTGQVGQDKENGDNNQQHKNGQSLEEDIDLGLVRPNEAGKIMILMYHVIGEQEGEWSRTWQNFRQDLEVLYEKGYRLISLRDYLAGQIKVEAGYSPVVITFDDGTQGQFNIIEQDGRKIVDPKCAVGIMEAFYEQHLDFGLEATFYIYYPVPFRQKDLIGYKLNYLVNKGMDIGNHTYGHANLGSQDVHGIQFQLGRMVAETKAFLPDYEVNSLALPYGANAKEEYREYVYSGSYQQTEYRNDGVLLVGSNPAFSPVDRRFDARRIPRIRATNDPAINTDMYDWIAYFEENPQQRYVSDGDENKVTVPRQMEDTVDLKRLGGRELRVYDIEP
jgi:peptidoglycan/xylan/chitin deacetylase (PgdA/CDA1 family)